MEGDRIPLVANVASNLSDGAGDVKFRDREHWFAKFKGQKLWPAKFKGRKLWPEKFRSQKLWPTNSRNESPGSSKKFTPWREDVEQPVSQHRSIYFRQVVAASQEVALNSSSSEEQTLLLLACMFESEPIPEVVFKIIFKSVYQCLADFSKYSELLERRHFIQIERIPCSTVLRRSWFMHSSCQLFIKKFKEKEIPLFFAKLCQQFRHDDIVAALFVLYGQEPWSSQAASSLGIPGARSLLLPSIRPIVWLLHSEPLEEWEKQSHQLAKQVLIKYLHTLELDDIVLSNLLAREETFQTTCEVLYQIHTSQNAPTSFKIADTIPNALETLVRHLAHDESPPLQQQATLTLAILSENVVENAIKIGSFPHAVERLVSFLEEGSSPQVQADAAWTLGQISRSSVENSIRIGSIPHVVERLVSLLGEGISPQIYEAVAWTLGQVSANVVENAIKIGSFPHAIERLVGLLREEMSLEVRGVAAMTLGQISANVVENATQIGSFPHAIERLVGLLGKGMSPNVQQKAAWTLGQISKFVMENGVKIGSLPHAVERLVGLLKKGMKPEVQGEAAWALGQISKYVVENSVKIGSFPYALEKLVRLLEEGMSPQVQGDAAWTLGQISATVVENAIKIGSIPHAVERLVGLLEEGKFAQAQEASGWALGQISTNVVENAHKIGSFPHSVERLVGLLVNGISLEVQGVAAWTLGQISKYVVDIAVRIGLFPHALERLLGLLEEGISPQVQEAAAWTLAQMSANVMENRVKIASFPHAMERLVGLLGEGMSQGSFVEPRYSLSNATKQLSLLVEEFTLEVQKDEEGGFLVSSEWLENLEQHEKEVLMLVLWREGFSEIYHTNTTVLYKRLDQNVETSNQISCSGYISNPTRLRKNPVQEEIQSANLDSDRKANKDCSFNSPEGKEELTVPPEQLSTSMSSFIASLKEKGLHSYCVSTEWLSKLQDTEKQMLKSVCTEYGYIEKYQTSSSTHYKRIEDHVSTCSDESTRHGDNDAHKPVGTTTLSGEQKKPSALHPKYQKSFGIDDADDLSRVLPSTSVIQPCLKSDDIRCVPQLLAVSCPLPPHSSTGASSSSEGDISQQNWRRLPWNDSYVTLPNQRQGFKISTKVDKTCTIPQYRFRGENELIPEDVSLQLFAESTVSCCLRTDNNEKQVRVKVSLLQGEIKHVAGPRILDLVLESVRTNVDASIYLGPREIEHLELDLNGPNPRPVEDGVWLALSGPNLAVPGSLNFELRCDVAKRRKGKEKLSLFFRNPKSPVVIEGEICGSFSDEQHLSLSVRYQVVACYSKPCGPFITGKPFTRTEEATWPVDLDCPLNYQTRN